MYNTFGDWNRQIQRQALMLLLFSSLYSSEKWAPSLPALPSFSPYSFAYKEGGAPMWAYATCELSLPSPPPLSLLIPLSTEPAHHLRDTITFHMLGRFLREITNTALLYFIAHIETGPIQKVSSENHHIGSQWVRGPAPTQLQPLFWHLWRHSTRSQGDLLWLEQLYNFTLLLTITSPLLKKK